MALDPDEQVVLIGCGQIVERDVPPEEAHEPIALMEHAAELAADDAGIGEHALARADHVVALGVLGARYRSPATQLAERLGATGACAVDSQVGGNTPQSAVNELARRIRGGTSQLAVLAGAEAIRTRRDARKLEVDLHWSEPGPAARARHELWGDDRPGSSERERRHGLFLPTHVFPVFENALRARLGRSPAEHMEHLGRLCSRMSEVAAKNPNAWFPTARSASEIATPTQANRIIAWPYTKYMNAVMEVNQGAALIIASEARARALGIPASRRVYLWGGGEAQEEPWFASERARFDACPAQRIAVEQALAQAGLDASSIETFDLYSCFPIAVELACEALGLDEHDPRPLTLTGGLAYAGGPGNAYSVHAIAQSVHRIRERGGSSLVSALGWYLTKHAVGVYGGSPAERPAREPERIRRQPGPELTDAPEGICTVASYTVAHARDGAPERGIVIAGDERGRRFVANTPADRELFEAMEAREFVGAPGRARPVDGDTLRFDPA